MVVIGVLGVKEFPWGSVKDKDKAGGMEKYVHDLLTSWDKEGYTFIIYTRHSEGLRILEKSSNIEIMRFKWLRGFYFRNISFNLHVFFYLILTKKKVDKLFVHGPIAGVLSLILRKIKKVETIYVPHGLAFTHLQYPKIIRKGMKIVDRINFLYHDYVILFSSQEAEHIRKIFKIKNHKIIPTAIKIRATPTEEKIEGKEKDKWVLLFVGRLVKVKGWDVLINAIEEINKEYKELGEKIEVWLVGEGKDKERIEREIKNRGLKNVKVLGWVENMEEVYSKADVFVLPSYSEGMPLTLLEAAHFSLPIITSSLNLDMNARVVFNTGDHKDLAEKIVLVINNHRLRKELIQKSNRFAKENSIEKMVEKYHKVFNK